jgi:hypothetical protein
LLTDPEGDVSISGSDADKRIMQECLTTLGMYLPPAKQHSRGMTTAHTFQHYQDAFMTPESVAAGLRAFADQVLRESVGRPD